jgi:hypothetical protein
MFVLAHIADYAFFGPVLVAIFFITGKAAIEQRRDARAREHHDA